MGGAVFPPCWLFGLRRPSTRAFRLLGGARSRCQNGQLMLMNIPWDLCYKCSCPHNEPQPTPASPGDPPRPVSRFSPGSYGVTALPWVPVHVKACVCPPRVESLFPQSCGGALALKHHWLSKPNALGAPSPNTRPLGLGAWCGAQNSYSCGRTSVIELFSSLWVARLAGMGFDYIAKAPLLLSRCGFLFVFGCKVSFLVGSSLFCWWLFSS